jgi:hypothetical protein
MTTLQIILLILIVVLFLGISIYSVNRFDKLLSIEYESNREAWIADGKPMGSFWWAPDESSLQNAFAGQRFRYKIVFKTPDWINQNEVAKGYLRQLRITILIWCIACVLFFILFVCSAATRA